MDRRAGRFAYFFCIFAYFITQYSLRNGTAEMFSRFLLSLQAYKVLHFVIVLVFGRKQQRMFLATNF